MNNLVVIEEHGEGGVTWLVAENSNPTPDQCVACESEEEARDIAREYAAGNPYPYLSNLPMAATDAHRRRFPAQAAIMGAGLLGMGFAGGACLDYVETGWRRTGGSHSPPSAQPRNAPQPRKPRHTRGHRAASKRNGGKA